MIIFDEKRHSQNILKSNYYQTLKYQGRERRALARYLKYDLGYNDYELVNKINSIKSRRREIYADDVWDIVMDSLIERYDIGDYVRNVRVGISKSELDVILNQPTTELRNLLFVLTVYFKWGRTTKERLCVRDSGDWVKEADIACCKIADLGHLRKDERMKLFYILIKNKVYEADYLKRYHSIFTLPFIDDKEPAIIIDDYIDVLAHLENYLDPEKCIKCDECKSLIRKNSNRQKFCSFCRTLYPRGKKLQK